ncbi:flagellar biosynthesis anti-sigma factor FlgM [uncultured Vagococcus sp.]|uniref:flagellar biosynthesis anti-sigma factor FlgM n=1 Tax=uncultured Vagococcus sp. TaxID=189676 RepID=UPI0028D22A1D|nr:flagellar biosynthesis anti-sigma factor FlgM [uncultured Vagococcus sp.]
MKIGNEYNPYLDHHQSVSHHHDVKEVTSQKADSVKFDISATSQHIRSKELGETKNERVAEIKQAINQGSYKVSTEELSNKLFDTLKQQRK